MSEDYSFIEDFDYDAIRDEALWLAANPHFQERPASIREFVGVGYLEIEDRIRPGIMQALVDIFGEEVDPYWISIVRRAMVTGGIGIGKTTFASIALPYMVHWVSCLVDPCGFFGLLPGSRIAFMQMSTSSRQAIDVVFGDIKARIENSPWFMDNAVWNKEYKNRLEFPKGINVLPGNSAETTFEGYNILGGILDEGDSHKRTEKKDYATEGYNTINSRINSRFTDAKTEKNRGLLICIGQMKSRSGFMAKKKKQLERDPDAHVVTMSIWESYGWDRYTDSATGKRKSFFYDSRRREIVTEGVARLAENSDIYEIPVAFQQDFDDDPAKAMRDLAGVPPETEDPFIALVDRIDECFERWSARYETDESPVTDNPTNPALRDWVYATDSLKRAMHIDIGISGQGDALGIAMGHVPELKAVGGEVKPYIVIDFVMRIKATPGTEIILSDVRQLIYELIDERNYKIKIVTLDGFQSTDTQQQLRRRRIYSDYLSVDRNKKPYEDLREAIYERRLDIPPYYTYLKKGDAETISIVRKELTELSDDGKKIDHPTQGSKDVADAIAGVVSNLMANSLFRRGRKKPPSRAAESAKEQALEYDGSGESVPLPARVAEVAPTYEEFRKAMASKTGIPPMTAPIPPTGGPSGLPRLPGPFDPI